MVEGPEWTHIMVSRTLTDKSCGTADPVRLNMIQSFLVSSMTCYLFMTFPECEVWVEQVPNVSYRDVQAPNVPYHDVHVSELCRIMTFKL